MHAHLFLTHAPTSSTPSKIVTDPSPFIAAWAMMPGVAFFNLETTKDKDNVEGSRTGTFHQKGR